MKHIAYPFLTIDSQIEASPWTSVEPDGSVIALGDHLTGWDYARNLRLRRSVILVDDAIGSSLALDADEVDLDLVVRFGTGAGTLPRRLLPLFRSPIRSGEPVLVNIAVEGRNLSQRLFLETTVVLRSVARATSRLAPSLAAAKLWRDTIDTALEGQTPRFPMELVSFAERFAGRPEVGAPWYLHWLPGELHRDFGGSVRLFLNHDRQDFIERFVGADPLTLQVTLADVITQILDHAVRQQELEELLDGAEPASIAGHIATWLELAFPGQPVASLRSMAEYTPGKFHAAILSMADPQVLGAHK
jgi:hypothetical protein